MYVKYYYIIKKIVPLLYQQFLAFERDHMTNVPLLEPNY